jgi:DNA repair protein RadC
MKNNFTQRTDELKPRELMERVSNPSLVPDEALLAILLKTGAQGLDVRELSIRLLNAFGSLKSLVSSDWRSIEERIKQYNKINPHKAIRGIGHVKCLELAAAFEIGRRWIRLSPEEIKKIKIETSEEAFKIFKTVIDLEDKQENVFILPLDLQCHPLCEPFRILRGDSSSVLISPKEIFREAVKWNAQGIIIAHNHPSGSSIISDDDLSLTKELKNGGDLLGIKLLDHLLIYNPCLENGFISILASI